MATVSTPNGDGVFSNAFGSPVSLFGAQPNGQRRGSLFSTHANGQPDLRERRLKLFERKPSDRSNWDAAPVEVPIKWDTTREFILYPDGKGGPVKLPSTDEVKRPSPEMVKKIRQGEPLHFLLGSKITPATEISHEWGYEGSIMLYDPKDPEEASIEYVFLTDHLPEEPETRQHVLAEPKRNLFFITLMGDSLPTYHFWQDVKNEGDPREADDFDWATYMDECASRRASLQLEADTTRVAGELHRAREYFDEDDDGDHAPTPRLHGTKRTTAAFANSSDNDSIPLGQPARKQQYSPTIEQFLFGSGSDDDDFGNDNDEALHRPFSNVFGSSGGYYVCPPELADYSAYDDAFNRLVEEFEENLRVSGLESTLKDFGFYKGLNNQAVHFGGKYPPMQPPKGNWATDRGLETVAFRLAVASHDSKPMAPLTGNEPWTRDDTNGYWNEGGVKLKPNVLRKRYQPPNYNSANGDPTNYRRPSGVEKNNTSNLFQSGFDNIRQRFAGANPATPFQYSETTGATPTTPTFPPQDSWISGVNVDSDTRFQQRLQRLRRRNRVSNLRRAAHSAHSSSHPAVRHGSSNRRRRRPSLSANRTFDSAAANASWETINSGGGTRPLSHDPLGSRESSFRSNADYGLGSFASFHPRRGAAAGTAAQARATGLVDRAGRFVGFDGAFADTDGAGDVVMRDAPPPLLHRRWRQRSPEEGLPVRELRVRDGRSGDGVDADPDRPFWTWRWAGAGGAERWRRFWEVVDGVLGGAWDGLALGVELRVYTEGAGVDSVWVDRDAERGDWEEVVGEWLEGHDEDDVYLIPIPSVSITLSWVFPFW